MQTIKQLLFSLKIKIPEIVKKIESSNNWICTLDHTRGLRLDQTPYPFVYLGNNSLVACLFCLNGNRKLT